MNYYDRFPPESLLISTEHQGKLLKGRIVYLDHSDLGVRIEEPFGGFETGLHIPYFAMQVERRWIAPDGSVAARTGEAAVGILLSLYEDCLLVKEGAGKSIVEAHIAEWLPQLREALARSRREAAEAAEERRVLKRTLRARAITEGDYQRRAKQLKAIEAATEKPLADFYNDLSDLIREETGTIIADDLLRQLVPLDLGA